MSVGVLEVPPKTVEAIEMPFWGQTCLGYGLKEPCMAVHIGATWRM